MPLGKWPYGAPGSDAALDKGCTCAVLENGHGSGRGGVGAKFGWWITEECPVHTGEFTEALHADDGRIPQGKWPGEPDPNAEELARRPIRDVGAMPNDYLDAS